MRIITVLLVIALIIQFSVASTEDPIAAAKEFVNKHLSDPNIFLVRPPKGINPYLEMPKEETDRLYSKCHISGATLSFYQDGMPYRYASWRDSKLHGLMQTWYPSGVVMAKEGYLHGNPMQGEYFNADGEKLGEIKDGIGTKFEFRPPVRGAEWRVATTEYKNGLKDGVEIGYRDYQNRKKEHEAYYKEGKRHGIKTTWMPSGQKNTEEHYVNGVQHGKSIYWHPNGTIQSVSEYVNGKMVDAGTRYYENGQVESDWEYDETGRLLQQKEYYPNGQVKGINDYNGDGATKAQSRYYEDGTKAEQIDDKGIVKWFSSGQLMYSIKKEGRWGKVSSGKSFNFFGTSNGKVKDGNGTLIKTFISDNMQESTLEVYRDGRIKKTIRLPKFSVVLGYNKGDLRIDFNLDFESSENNGWEGGKFTIILPQGCSSDDPLEYEIKPIAAGQVIDFSWMDITIPEKVEEWTGQVYADIEGVVDGYPVRYQHILYNSTLNTLSDKID